MERSAYISPYVSLYAFSFFFNDTATTEIYTLSLHDALPIFPHVGHERVEADGAERGAQGVPVVRDASARAHVHHRDVRSEEHTSELQSQSNLVCRLLLEKKKNTPKHRAVTSLRPPGSALSTY